MICIHVVTGIPYAERSTQNSNFICTFTLYRRAFIMFNDAANNTI